MHRAGDGPASRSATCGPSSDLDSGAVNRNSQHIVDWYTFTHLEHGFGLYFLAVATAPVRLAADNGLALAALVEVRVGGLENSNVIIDATALPRSRPRLRRAISIFNSSWSTHGDDRRIRARRPAPDLEQPSRDRAWLWRSRSAS